MTHTLTPEEQLDMENYRQARWEQARKPVNRRLTEKYLKEAYRLAEVDAPETIIWVKSPLEAQLVISSLMYEEKMESAKTKSAKAKILNECKSIKKNVGDITLEGAAAALKKVDKELLIEGFNNVNWPWFYGDGWWFSWTSYYAWCNRLVNKLKGNTTKTVNDEKIEMLEKLTAVAGWIWSFENGPSSLGKSFAICSERPEYSKWTTEDIAERPVLHSADSPSVKFSDIELFHWRGTPVPREWIMAKETVDPKLGLTHPNIEQRRVLTEILGWKKILEGLNMRVIDANKDPEIGTLIEVDLPDAPKERFIRVQCGTKREFILPVPKAMKTALEANAWTYGLTPDEYQPEVRT